MNKSREIYLARNRTKRQCKVFTFEAMKSAAEDMAFKLYGKRSFSLACHMALYKLLRDNGFIDLRKLLMNPNSPDNEFMLSSKRGKRTHIKSDIKNPCQLHPIRTKQLNHNLIKNHGIDINEKQNILKAQDYKCAICKRDFVKKPDYYMSVDHNHITGKIRGIICGNCNKGIGFLMADYGVDLLKNAINYIESYVSY